jgi:hypothetical protein
MNQCFWDGFEKNNYLFCEEQLCAFVTEPANTWTNIGYLIVAIMILKQKEVTNRRVKNLFFTASFCLFIGSSLFHMTSTFWGRLVDVSTMFILSMTILTLSVERYSEMSEKKANLFFVLGLTLSLTFLFVMKFGHVLFFGQLVAVTILEFRLGKTTKSLDMKGVKLAIIFLIVAFTFWILDVAKVLCHPGNHILTGHGVWHLLAGASFYVFFKSYKGKESF